MKGEYWNTDPYCYCANSAWGKVDGIRDIPIGGTAVTGLGGDDTAALAAGLIGLAALLFLLLCILCCLCPPGLCLSLCPCLAACCGKKKAAAAGAGAGAGAVAGGGGARSDKLREVDIKLPRAWVESFRGVPVEDFDNKLKALEASGWVGMNDGYGSWFGDDANSMSTLLKGSGTGGYQRGNGDEVDGYKKGHNRMSSTYLTSEEIFGTTKATTSSSAGDRADKKRDRDYEYGSVISAKYGDEMRGESEADLDRSTTTLLRNPSDGSSGGVYNYGYNRNEETTHITTHMSEADQEKQRELLERQEKLQYQQEQLLIQQQAALLAQQNAELNNKHNSGMNEISEMSMSSTVANEGQTITKPMSSKVIYEATRETRTVTDESGNVSKTHSETKDGDGAKVIGVISKNGTFRRVKGGDVEYMTQEDIKRVPVEDFDNKLKALEASGWVGMNDGYGSWFGDDANSMSTLLKGSGTGGYQRGNGDEVDGYKKGHNRMSSTYLTSEEIFGTTKTTTSSSAGDRADKKRDRDYEYGSVISAKYGDEMRGESEADLDRSTTTLLRNPSDGSSGGVYNYGYNRNEETTHITTHMSEADQEKQRELLERQEKLQYQQEQLLIQQQAALLAQQNAELNNKHNSGMNEISEMSMSSTVANEGQTITKPMSSKVIYEATRETRTVTDESGNVSKTHSETKDGDGAKVIGVISKNGTFRRVKGGDVEYMTQDDIKSKDVKCLTSENVMKLYQSYQRSRSGSTAGSRSSTTQKALESTDNVSL